MVTKFALKVQKLMDENNLRVTKFENKNGYTSLFAMIENSDDSSEDVEILKNMLDYGLDINHQSQDFLTPLCLATFHDHVNIAHALLTYGTLNLNMKWYGNCWVPDIDYADVMSMDGDRSHFKEHVKLFYKLKEDKKND